MTYLLAATWVYYKPYILIYYRNRTRRTEKKENKIGDNTILHSPADKLLLTVVSIVSWRHGKVVRILIFAGKHLLSCFRLAVDGVTTLWEKHLVSVSHLGQLSHPSIWDQ